MQLNRIKNILKKAKMPIGDVFAAAIKGGKIEDYDSIEEQLILSDMSIDTTEKILKKLKGNIKDKVLIGKENVLSEVKGILKDILKEPVFPDENKKPLVIIFSGINGSGKTTSIAKLGKYYKEKGFKILFGACDTFRAAAEEQISIWASRLNIDIYTSESKDPAAAAYSSYIKAVEGNYDLLIIDTAGRMHTNYNLMTEIKKVYNVLRNKFEDINIFSILVIDGTTGKNALVQAKQFKDSINIDTLFLTKIDGTAKGGTIITIADELSLPISYIGVGESFDDLWIFDKKEFTDTII